jgi:hypothetical protein
MRIAAYANATLNHLARELRDEVYKHLWDSYTYRPSYDPDKSLTLDDRYASTYEQLEEPDPWETEPDFQRSIYGFLHESISPSFLSQTNQTFAEETVQYFFENGCTERYVAVEDLPQFLATPFPGFTTTPQSCLMRSINVKICAQRFDTYLVKPMYTVEPYFGALMAKAHNGLKLHVRVIVSYWADFEVDARSLPSICSQLKRVIEDFEATGSRVTVKFAFMLAAMEPLSEYYRLNPTPSMGASGVHIVGTRGEGTEFDAIVEAWRRRCWTPRPCSGRSISLSKLDSRKRLLGRLELGP